MAGHERVDEQQRRNRRVEAQPPDPGDTGNHF
jgi:hypothetical protein